MQILEDLAASEEPLSITDLSDRQGKGRNEIYRMLCCLDSLGYIVKDEANKRYSLSLKLYQMATYHPPIRYLRLSARRALQELSFKINESCHLCVLDGSHLSVVEQVSGPERIRIAFKLGARFDPLETSSGKLLLSEYDEARRQNLLAVSRIWQQAKAVEKEAIMTEIMTKPSKRIWEEGSSLREGIYDIAVALGSPDTVHATLAVAHIAGRSKKSNLQMIREHVIATAKQIEDELGLVAPQSLESKR